MDFISKTEIDKRLGKVLKDFRVKNKFTQEKMAEKLGISVKYVSRIENGMGGLKTETTIKYMNILGVTPNILYKDVIDNEEIKQQIEFSEKIKDLSIEKIKFLKNIIEPLKNL